MEPLILMKNITLPVILMFAGLFFLALPFLPRISARIKVSGKQRILFLGIGMFLLIFGASLFLLPAGMTGITGGTGSNPPTILGVTIRADQEASGLVYQQEINFYDEDGDTNQVERELVELSEPSQRPFIPIQNGAVDAPPEVQKIRATLSETWRCEGHIYLATIEATLVDSQGNRSEPVRYRIDCK
jgi:hypothetical protein